MTFSIIIPVYNVAPYLRACLDSVVAAVAELEKVGGGKWWTKDVRHWVEMICVDDGSTDGSSAILDEYREKVEKIVGGGHRMVVLHQKNAGVSAARNAALEIASGEWICFVDSDDCVHPDLLSRCCQIVASGEVEIVFYGKELFFEEHSIEPLKVVEAISDISTRLTYDIAESDFFQFAYSRELLDGLRFPAYIMGEDRLFLAWILVRVKRLARIDGVGYYYRQRIGSAVNSRRHWRKFYDDAKHSVRRLKAFLLCRKHVDWHVYRHQMGLWVNMIWRVIH